MKRSRRALWILLATLAAALLAVDFSTRRGEVASHPPVAARSSDKRSGARRRVATGSLASLARDSSHSTGLDLARRLNESLRPGHVGARLGDYTLLAADARHSTGIGLVAHINQQQDNHDDVFGRLRRRLIYAGGGPIAASERLGAARMGWSGCSAYACGCDHLGGGHAPPKTENDAIARRGFAADEATGR